MSILFQPVKIGNLEIKNRFVRSATYFALADENGFVGERSVDLACTLAASGLGLIITGATYVLANGQVHPNANGIQDDDHIPGYQRVTKAVHERDGKIIMQLFHGGAESELTARSGGEYMAVSVVGKRPNYGVLPREMDEEDILTIVEGFGQAARRAEEAGFDGIQIHGAYLYLVSQFLSPVTNRREDRWGGSLENRIRFVVEVTRAIKRNVGEGFPITIKLGCRDYVDEDNAFTIEEGAEVGRILQEEGICFIEISQGLLAGSSVKKRLGITSPEKEAYFLHDAEVVRMHTSCPLCLVGGMRSLPVMEAVVTSGIADCVSLCRPLIREPELIKRWLQGDAWRADCISCGGCFNLDQNKKMHIFCRQINREI